MAGIIQKINGKWVVNGKKISGYVYRSTNDNNIYMIGSDGSRTYLRETDRYQPSQSIINYVKKTEAFSPKWYKDGKGYWTIGFGMKETPELRKSTETIRPQLLCRLEKRT